MGNSVLIFNNAFNVTLKSILTLRSVKQVKKLKFTAKKLKIQFIIIKINLKNRKILLKYH